MADPILEFSLKTGLNTTYCCILGRNRKEVDRLQLFHKNSCKFVYLWLGDIHRGSNDVFLFSIALYNLLK